MTLPFIKGYGPPCPYCGHIKSARIHNGWSEPDDHYLRYKKCDGCKAHFATVEVIVPPDQTTFYRLDYHGRELRRERWRRRYAKTNIRRPSMKMDQLTVKVSVNGAGDMTHCFRGHEFTPENTYHNPRDKWRRCRLCRNIAQRSYYLKQRGAA
jgi:hypothetical protein